MDDPQTTGSPAEDLESIPTTSLDPLETKSPNHVSTRGITDYVPFDFDYQCPTQLELDFRHSGWARIRDLVFHAFQRIETRPNTLDNFWACGAALWLQVRDDKQEVRTACNHCNNRWCQPCARTRATFISDNLKKHLPGRDVRFLTLTLRHNDTPLTDQLDRLYRSFNVFRRRASWKQHIKGGCTILEIKIGRDGRWHPHLHCLVEGSWWQQKNIATEWQAVTGDSSIVHITQVDSVGQVVHYVTKYLTKCVDNSIYHVPERLDEAIKSVRGRRLIFTFGCWRGVRVTPKAPEQEGHQWENVGRYEDLLHRSLDGDPEACRWIEALKRKHHPTTDAGAPHDAAP